MLGTEKYNSMENTKESPVGDQKVALILQGGGALGAYQAGVYEGLHDELVAVDWVVGTSIGAITGAIIAGNKPENRIAKLHAFWNLVGRQTPAPFSWMDVGPLAPFYAWARPMETATRNMDTMMNGIPGFFKPRPGATFGTRKKVPSAQAGFYDTSPLEETLNSLVDFEYLNNGPVRLTVCAVSVTTGQMATFDSKKITLTAKHIMASGALPPGFPPVEIDGDIYWDGGIYSNTPMDVVLDDDGRGDMLCFMIDLWNPKSAQPTSIDAAISRYKDIQYASRSLAHLLEHKEIHDLRLSVKRLSEQLSAKEQGSAYNQQHIARGNDSSINVVHVIMKGLPGDDQNKDIDFSRETISARWAAGGADISRALLEKQWMEPLEPGVGMAIHTLYQEPAPV
jgi:NTE family protein